MSEVPIFFAALINLGYFVWVFLICKKKNDLSLIDLGWSGAFLVIYLSALFGTRHWYSGPHLIVLAYVGLWAARLFQYLRMRARGRPEDPRYQKLRASYGNKVFQQAFVRIFLSQWLMSLIVAAPLFVIAANSKLSVDVVFGFGSLVFFSGLIIESLADHQMQVYKLSKRQAGEFLQSGLWKYSRHPNYFGEILLWLGLAIVSKSAWGFVGPAFLTFLITSVTGIPPLEEKHKDNARYQEYKKQTPALLLNFRALFIDKGWLRPKNDKA